MNEPCLTPVFCDAMSLKDAVRAPNIQDERRLFGLSNAVVGAAASLASIALVFPYSVVGGVGLVVASVVSGLLRKTINTPDSAVDGDFAASYLAWKRERSIDGFAHYPLCRALWAGAKNGVTKNNGAAYALCVFAMTSAIVGAAGMAAHDTVSSAREGAEGLRGAGKSLGATFRGSFEKYLTPFFNDVAAFFLGSYTPENRAAMVHRLAQKPNGHTPA